MVLGDAQGTVEGEPAHELGVDVVGAIAADLPDASIGLAPAAGDLASEAVHRAPCLGVEPVPVVGEEPCCVEYPAVAVELVLPRRPVAEAYRPAAGVPGPGGKLAFGRRMPAVEGEQDRQAAPVQPAGVQQPGREQAGFGGLADAQEGADADAGVARPRVTVVPVADAAQIFGQRCGGGRDRRARWRVGEKPQGEQASHDSRSPRGVVADPARPFLPSFPALLEQAPCRGRLGDHERFAVGGGEHKRHGAAGFDPDREGTAGLDR